MMGMPIGMPPPQMMMGMPQGESIRADGRGEMKGPRVLVKSVARGLIDDGVRFPGKAHAERLWDRPLPANLQVWDPISTMPQTRGDHGG